MHQFTPHTNEALIRGLSQILTVHEAAPLLGVSRSTFLSRVKAGAWPQPVYLSPRRPVWRMDDLVTFIENV